MALNTNLPDTPTARRGVWRLRRLLVAAVALVAALALALHLPWVQRRVFEEARGWLASRQIALSATRLRYNLFSGSVAIEGLEVRAIGARDATPMVTARRASVDLAMLSLLTGAPVIQTVRLSGVSVVHLVDEAGGNWPVTPTSDPSAAESPRSLTPPVWIRDLVLEDGLVRYDDRTAALEVVVPIPRATVAGSVATRRHTVTLDSRDVRLRRAEQRLVVDTVDMTVSVGETDVVLDRLDLRAVNSTLRAEGRVDGLEDPRVTATASADIDTAAAAAAAGVTEPLSGRLVSEVSARGPLAALQIGLEARSDALSARGLAPARLHLAGRVDTATERGTLETLTLDAPWGAVSATGQVSMVDTAATTIDLTARRMHAPALMRAAEVPVTLASMIDARVSASFPGVQYERASGETTITLEATQSSAAANLLPVSGQIRGTADDGRGSARVRLTAPGLQVSGEAGVRARSALSGEVRIVAGSAEALATAQALLARPEPLSPMPVAGTVVVEATLAGDITAPRAQVTVEAPALTIGERHDVTVAAQATYSPDLVELPVLSARWLDGVLEGQGRAELTGDRTLTGHATIDGVDIARIGEALHGEPPPVAGRVAMALAVAGTVDAPLATVSATATELVAASEPLGTLTIEASLAGQDVELQRLHLEKPQDGSIGTLEARGTYHLDTGAYRADVRTDGLRLERLRLGDDQRVSADVELSIAGEGTIDQPQADIRLRLGALLVDERDLGSVDTRVAVADGRAAIEASAPQFVTTVAGDVEVDAPYAARLELVTTDLDLAALPLAIDKALEGRLGARARFEGTLADAADGVATVTLETLDASWQGEPIVIDSPATLEYADHRVTIDDLVVRARDSAVRVSGRLPIDEAATEPADLTIDAALILASLAAYLPTEQPVRADGRIDLEGRVTGAWGALDPVATLRVTDGLLTTPALDVPVTDVTLDARLESGVAVVTALNAAWGAARLAATARAPLSLVGSLPIVMADTGEPARLDVDVRDVDPGTVPGAPEGLAGDIALTARFEAPRADLEAVVGDLRFETLDIAFDDIRLSQTSPATIALADGAATIQSFTLSGSAGELSLDGRVALDDSSTLDLSASGNLDLAVAHVITDAVRAEGPVHFDVRASGTTEAPDIQGYLEVTDGTLVVDEPTIAVERLAVRLDMAGPEVTLSTLGGDVNGGALSGWGGLTLGGDDGIAAADLSIDIQDLAFSAPLDLRSLSDVRLHLARVDEGLRLDGTVTVAEAGLTGHVNFDTGILATIGRPRGLDLTSERQPLVEQLQLDVAVKTATPILIDNNLATAELTTDVRVIGNPYDLGLAGQMELLPGSTVTLNERRYQVERGLITFLDETRIAPSFDLRLTTAARQVDVTLAVTGEVGETDVSLTSDPALPEPDIMALLVTGRTLDEMRGEEYDVAREQMLSFLTGRAGSALGRGLQRATGLSEVRVEPTLIASETESVARLTVGQDITDQLRLVYSTDLSDSSNQIWMTEYDITRRFRTRVVRQDENTYRFDFRHELRFGGEPEPRRVQRQRSPIADIAVAVDGPVDEAWVRDRLRLKPGDPYDFFRLRDAIERVEAGLREQGYLQARVRNDRVAPTAAGEPVSVAVRVEAGPRVRLRFVGDTPPNRVREALAVRWQRGVFDTQRAGDGVDLIREWLIGTRRLAGRVEYAIDEPAAGQREVTFTIDPGPRFERVTLAFEGAAGVSPDVLRDVVRQQRLEQDLFTDPLVVTELLRRYYREEGYLAARLDAPEPVFAGSEARVVIRVTEGPRFVVDRLQVSGNETLATETLLAEAPLVPGDVFLPAVAERSLDRLRQLYWRQGHNEVRLRYDVEADRETGRTDVTILVVEGARSVVADVVVAGQDRTTEPFVRGEIELEPGETLDLAAVGRSRRHLYNSGAFSTVDVLREPVGPVTSDGEQPVRATVTLREVPPFQMSYGLSFDTLGGPGGLVDLTNHNSLGQARVVGLSARYDARRQQGRLFVSQPMLRRSPIQAIAATYVRQERNPATANVAAFNVDRFGGSLQLERQLRHAYVWNYGIAYEQARTFSPLGGSGLDERATLTPITSTLTRETRDEVLDATRGSFISQAFTYSPAWLGSDRSFVKYYGQYFAYWPLQPERRERLTHEILRPRLVLAFGARVGLARGLGGDVPLPERFLAGGATTLRGFAENALGPRNADGTPAGGEATFVLNTELRFPLVGMFDGVGFVDIGGVTGRLAAWTWRDVRETAGLGLRVRTPWFLLRGDYGFVLDGRPGEPRSRFFFSIGQAF